MDGYVKVRQIGEGAFGKAVLVKGKRNGRQYVVKEIRIAKVKRQQVVTTCIYMYWIVRNGLVLLR